MMLQNLSALAGAAHSTNAGRSVITDIAVGGLHKHEAPEA